MKQNKFKQTEIGMIPEDWEIKTLGEFISIKHGFAFKGEFFSDVPNENILLTPGNFHIGGGFKSDKFKYYIGSYPEEYALKENDLIVTMTDLSKEGDTLGYSALIPKGNGNRFLHNQRLGLVILESKSIDKAFLYWVLRTRNYHIFVVNTASGSTVKHTAPTRIYDYKFALPKSVEEQQSIAKILSDLDSKIELNLQMNTTLEKVGQTLFKHWFIDFEFPNEKGKLYKSSGGKMVDSELGEIPKGWRVAVLPDVCLVVDCLHTKKPEMVQEGTLLLQVYNIAVDGTLDFSEKYNVSENDYQEWTKNIEVKEGDCLITNAGRVGAVAQVPAGFKGGIGRNITAIRPNDVTFTYLFRYLFSNSGLMEIERQTDQGTVLDSLNVKGIRKIRILVPPPEIMNKFEKIARPLREKVERNKKENDSLMLTRDSLLPKLMSGRIRVKTEILS
jgi:type I restriction enzyme S subunit